MPEPITIPADTDLPRAMGEETWKQLNAWYAANGVLTGQVTASRPVVMTDDSIDRWEIVGSSPDVPWPPASNVSKRGGYQLAEGEEWTNDDDFAVAVNHVISPVSTPLSDELRTVLLAAIA